MKRFALTHEFVEAIPEDPQEGTLYVSMRFRTVVHLCACGCGNKVVTPLRPARWHLTFDGDSVSLSPSVGSWQFPCRSHYWIDRDRVRWAKAWTDEQIAAGRASDARDIQQYYADRQDDHAAVASSADARRGSLFSRAWRRLRRRA